MLSKYLSINPDVLCAWSSLCLIGLVLSRFTGNTELELFFTCGGVASLLVVVVRRLLWNSRDPISTSLSLIDVAVVLIWCTEVAATHFSIYARNSFTSTYALEVVTIVYGLSRYVLRDTRGLAWGVVPIALLGSIYASFQSWIEIQWFKDAVSAGFSDLSAIKAHSPGAIIPLANSRATVMLLFVPFALLMTTLTTGRKLRHALVILSALCVTSLTVALLLTMSRGGLLALVTLWVVLLIGAAVRRIALRRMALICITSSVIAVGIVMAYIPVMKAQFENMVLLRQSPSQKRSTEGHISVWRTAWSLGKEHPLVGAGPGNFPIEFAPEESQSETGVFAAQTFNIPLQLFVERGVIGVASFGILIVIVFFGLRRGIAESQSATMRQRSLIHLAFLASIIVRELTYSTVLLSAQASVLIWLLLADIASRDITISTFLVESPTRKADKMAAHEIVTRWSTASFCAALIWILCVSLLHMRAVRGAYNAAQYFRNNENIKGIDSMRAALSYDPNNAYFLSILGLAEGQLAIDANGTIAPSNIALRKREGCDQHLHSAIDAYRKAAGENPLDDNFANNLGWLYFVEGDRRKAEQLLRRAIELNPSEALYHIGLGILLRSDHKDDSLLYEWSVAIELDPRLVSSPVFTQLQSEHPNAAQVILTESRGYLLKSYRKTGDPILSARLGALLMNSGKSRESLPFLEYAVETLPGLSYTWENLGNALYNVKKYDEGDLAYKKAHFLQHKPGWSDQRRSSNVGDASILLTEHSARVASIYMTDPLVSDDILPPGLLDSCAAVARTSGH